MPQQPGVMRNRWTAYAGVSAALAAGVILKSLAQRPNFYSAAVYLSQSNANLMILCNLVFVTACSVILFFQRTLYGPLRPIEIEQLYEKAWFAVTETCLAMTIFRGEIGAWFLVMFFSLLAGKVWGWIGEGRVEVLEQQQHNILTGGNTRLFHTRLAASLALSVVFDLTMLEYIVGQVLHMARPDMMVMFGFEFAVLSITSISTAMRYGLNLVEIGIVRKQKQKRIDVIRKGRVDAAVREIQEQQTATQDGSPPQSADLAETTQRIAQASQAAAAQPIDEADIEVEGWDAKGRWTFYLDLATDFFKLVTYLSFFFILLIFYGLPLHIMRDVFLTCRSFFKRISDFMRYRTATRDMNERYPDATEAEIGREDVCIICREEMRPYVPPAQGQPRDPVIERMRPKKLPCGHVLHFSCLRSWLERQQICPTCRATVVSRPQARSGATAAPGAAQAHPQNRANHRPRVFQFGPLRIGVGAARGNNMLEELEQRLVNIDQPEQGENAPQQYGFGIRWGGARVRARAHRQQRGTVEDQLNAAERQIQREIDALQVSMGELQALRNIQAQLARVRLARNAAAGQNTTVPPATQSMNTMPTVAAVNTLQQDPSNIMLQAGSDQLPAGLTLPEGWTMMPLQPMNAQQMPNVMIPPQIIGMQNGMTPTGSNVPLPSNPSSGTGANVASVQSAPTNANQNQGASRSIAEQINSTNIQQRTDQSSTQTSEQNDRAPTQVARTASAQARVNPTTTSNTANEFLRGADRPSASITAPSPRPMRTQPVQQATQPQTRSGSSVDSRVVPFAQSQNRGVTSTQNGTRLSATTPARTTPASSAVQPPKLSPGIVSDNRTTSTSPHRPTRSVGSSWGFSGADEKAKDGEDDDDNDDDEEDEEEDDDNDDDEDDVSDSDEAPRKGKIEASRAQATSRRSGSGKAPTVEDLVEDPD